MEDIFSDLNAPKEKEPETIWDTVDGTQTMSSENYGSSVDQNINMPTYKEPEYGETIINYNYSLTDLEKDPEFAKRASRFLDGIGSNDNIFEYLRDSDYSLSAAAVRSFQTGKWTKEQKEDYVYLKGFKERFNMVKDIGIDILGDPLNILAALFAIPTGGISLGTRGALGAAAQAGVNKFTAAKAGELAVTQTGTKALTAYQLAQRAKLVKKSTIKAAKAGGLYGAAEGMAWGGLHDYFMQDIDVDLDMRDSYDISSIAGTTALGGLLGGGIGAGVSGFITRKNKSYLTKEYKHSNETLIENVGESQTRAEVLQDSIIDTGLAGKGPLSKAIAHTFGKPTTWFQGYVDKSPALQDFMKKLRYDYDTTLTSRGESEVKEKSFGLDMGETIGKFQYGLAKSLNVLYRVGWRARLDPKQNTELVTMLRDNTLTLKSVDKVASNYDPAVVRAYKGVRETLDAAFDEANAADLFGPGVRRAAGYFPRLFKYDVLENKQSEFKQLLIKSGHADPLNDLPSIEIIDDLTDEVRKGVLQDAKGVDVEIFGKDFLQQAGVKGKKIGKGKEQRTIYSLENATPEQIQKAKELKADQIVKDMLEYRWTPFELRSKGQADAGSGFLQERRFRNIKDSEMAEFLEDDVQQILETYFTNTGQAISRSRFFGRTILEFEKNTIEPMRLELQASKMGDDDIKKVLDRVRLTHRRVTGIETDARSPLKKNKWARTAADFGKLTQQMAHLPFATLSSITEPFLLLTRAGAKDAPKVFKDIGSALIQEGNSVLDRSWKGIQRGVFRKKTTGVKDLGAPSTKKGSSIFDNLPDEDWGELYKTGLALEQAVQERIEGLAGEGMHNSVLKNIQAGFFKANLLTQWTKAVQLASFTTGKRLIKQRAQALYEHQSGKKLIKLTGDGRTSTTKYYRRQLNDLGIKEQEAIDWYKNSLDSNGVFSDALAKKQDFYDGAYTSGANRFTKEIILNPSTAEANRPLWFSTPSAQLLVQFAGYPTVFNNTVLKRFSNELFESPIQSMPKAIPTMLLMTSVAHIGNTIRSQGANLKDYETGFNKGEFELIGEGMRRWGGYGPFDYANRYGNEAERNVGGFTAGLKTFAGPLPQDAIDAILYRKGLPEIGVTNLPFYGALPADIRKDLRSSARGSTPKKTSSYRGSLAKGGLVYNVSNVHPEPDEVKMRGSNQTYNEVAGVVLRDEEDRIFKNKGGTVYNKLKKRKRKNYMFGGISMLGKNSLIKFLTNRINSPLDKKNIPTPPESSIVNGKIKKNIDLTQEEIEQLDKEFFESGKATEFTVDMLYNDENFINNLPEMSTMKTSEDIQESIEFATKNITKKLTQQGIPELEIARLIKNAKKKSPDDEMFWAADDELYNAIADTVPDKDLMSPTEQAFYKFDEFGNILEKKAIVNQTLQRDALDPNSKLGEVMAEFDSLVAQRETMVNTRLAKLSLKDKEKRQGLLDEFMGVDETSFETSLYNKEQKIRRARSKFRNKQNW